MDRRAFLAASARIAALAALGPLGACAQPSGPVKFDRYPFTLGVASGDPLPDRVVLWTRLAPAPLKGGGVPKQSCAVEWLRGSDEAMRDVARTGGAAGL